MGLFDFLTNAGNTIKNKIQNIGQDPFQQYAQNMPALQLPEQNTGAAAPMVQGLQLSPDGSSIQQVDTQPMNTTPAANAGLITRAKSGIQNFNLGDALLGKAANPTDNIGDLNGETISASVSSNPRVGGLFNDLTAGARENFNNRFDTSNLSNNIGSDGRKKGFAYRIGEGLGTLGRFMESPLGRMALTAGIVGATGGSGLEALTYGGQAGVTNQKLRSADQLYRQQLKDNYGFTDDQLNNVRGYVSKDDFNTLATNAYRNRSLQVRQAIAGAQDNTKRANLIMQGLNNGTISPEEAKLHMVNYGITFDDLSKSNASRNADMNEELLPYKKYALQMTPQIALGNLGVAQGRLGLARDEFDYKKNNAGTSAPTKPQILTNPQVRANLVEYKKTKNSKDRQAMNEWFLKETGYTADYLLGEL